MAAVLIPSALAYAGIVGVEPIVRLYTVPAIAVLATLLLGPLFEQLTNGGQTQGRSVDPSDILLREKVRVSGDGV